MRYLLDTSVISQALRNPSGPVGEALRNNAAVSAVSVIVEAELRFGIANNPGMRKSERVAAALEALPILPFTSQDAVHYGKIRANLEVRGIPIGAMDSLIAAHARSRSLHLVTNNIKHFAAVDGLDVVDWHGP